MFHSWTSLQYSYFDTASNVAWGMPFMCKCWCMCTLLSLPGCSWGIWRCICCLAEFWIFNWIPAFIMMNSLCCCAFCTHVCSAEKPTHAATAHVHLSRFCRLCKLHGVETCQRVIASDIIGPEQITSITIERAVWCWIWHESNDSLAYRLECPCWAPSCFQYVQTDFTSLEMNVWVENFGLETHIWSYQRILLRHLEYNLKNTTLKRCVFWTLQEAFPRVYVVFVRSQLNACIVLWKLGDLLELLKEPCSCRHAVTQASVRCLLLRPKLKSHA